VNYWQFGDYVGVGAGAHGKLTSHASKERARLAIVRSARIKQPREFLRRAAAERVSDRFEVESADLPFEYMLNVLRLTDDFDAAGFEARTGLEFETIARPLAEAERKLLLEQTGAGKWRVTELGQRFLNDLQAIFLPESVSVGQSAKTPAG
jgi:oxygen-independent coproporphyrinogen-3 oxidase